MVGTTKILDNIEALMDVIKVNSLSSLPKIILLIHVRAKLILIFKRKKIQDRGATTQFLVPIVCTLSPTPKITYFNFFMAFYNPFRCWLAAHFADAICQFYTSKAESF